MQYSIPYKRTDTSVSIKTNYGGNNVKSMHVSVEHSLKKLRTSYIDILYVHWVSSLLRIQNLHSSLMSS